VNISRLGLICLFQLLAKTGLADQQNIQFIMNGNTGSELQLEVRQAPLAQVLDKIADATGVSIHYSVLPRDLVSTTCAGPTISRILTCLLERKADLVYRYGRVASQGHSQPQREPEEVWVLAINEANSAACNPSGNCIKQAFQDKKDTKTGSVQNGIDETGLLLKMAASGDPAQRLDAVALLAIKGRGGDADVRKALENALSDRDATVRAQALSSLARREGDGAALQLQDALKDSDVSVRLMAVDSAGDNPVLLQQAITDSDETVRTLATMKLEALTKAGG